MFLQGKRIYQEESCPDKQLKFSYISEDVTFTITLLCVTLLLM